VFVLIVFVITVSPDRAAVVTIHRSGREKQQGKSSTIKLKGVTVLGDHRQLAGRFPFL
jgi:hypothetical protein